MSSAAVPKALSYPDPLLLEEILRGLEEEPKRLPCKLFYDPRGSRLFEEICTLPEYYLFRAELEILERHGADIAARIGPRALLIEFGSGSSRKTRSLLDALVEPAVYIPVDISPTVLYESARALRRSYPELDVRPLAADYQRPLQLPLSPEEQREPLTIFFSGSTIGNFEPDEARWFLARLRQELTQKINLLIGVDTPKPPEVLEAAYDDAAGVTAAFNMNILRVLNRDFDAQFIYNEFRHRALWNPAQRRIEMQLVSQRAHAVNVAGSRVNFRAGEPIITEYCHKYSPGDFALLAENAGFQSVMTWQDAQSQFCVHLLAGG